MNEPLLIWAGGLLRLGLVLLAVGVGPALAVQFVLTGVDPLIPALLLFSVAPLAGLALAAALILFLAARVRRPPGGSS